MERKGKGTAKRFLIAAVLIAAIIGTGCSCSNSEEEAADSSAPKAGTEIQINIGEADGEDKPPESSTPETDTEAQNDVNEVDASDKIEGSTAGITDLLNDYNAIAEYPVTSDMIDSGARSYDNWVSINGISVHITNTEKAMFVDYDWEGPDDSAIVPVMRDFCKAIAPSLADEDFDVAIEELRSGKYQYYDRYTFGGIEAMYNAKDLAGTEDIRYTVKTEYDLGT